MHRVSLMVRVGVRVEAAGQEVVERHGYAVGVVVMHRGSRAPGLGGGPRLRRGLGQGAG